MVHVMQIVHILQAEPIGLEGLVLTEVYTLSHGIEFIERLLLQVITGVDAQVLGFTAPGERIRTGEYVISCQFLGCLGRGHEAHLTLEGVVRQGFEEIEDTCSGVLTDTESLGAYPDVDDLFAFRQRLQHVRIFLCVHREVSPVRIGEMETEFITEVGVTQQHFHLRCTGGLVYLVRGLPTEYMLGTFGQDHFVTHLVEVISRFVGVEQLGVPNGLCLDAQDGLEQFALELKLFLELLFVVLRSEGVSVRRSEELNGFGSCQLLEDIDHLRVELLKHLDHRSADADGTMEFTFGEVDHVFDRLAQRQVRGLYQPVYMLFGSHVIVVVMIMTDFKETIALQTIRCVHLEA